MAAHGSEERGDKTLETLNFDNLVLRALPVDEETRNFVREVRGACYSRVNPTPLKNPQLVAHCLDALSLIDLDAAEVKRPEFVSYFSGNQTLPGSDPAAHCYCGHQFGQFAGQLGDGAAIYLGEVVNLRNSRWEVQLKGAGPTPYSRSADGRKVLRSSIREFLCSEAIYNLGIPTTRAGCIITSDSLIERDIFYTGNPVMERCSVVSRIAPTFMRFGSFEIFKPIDGTTGRAGPSCGLAQELLPRMVDHVIKTYYPQLWQAYGGDHLSDVSAKQELYCDWLREVFKRTAALVAGWQSVGFTHGVLNSDNMSILGLTLDYGPFGFMDRYDPNYVPNHSDDMGRYNYRAQPEICRWNCEKLCEALQEVVPLKTSLPLLNIYDAEYERGYREVMRRKLGLLVLDNGVRDQQLVDDLLATMNRTGADFNNTFRCLARFPLPQEEPATNGGTGNGESRTSSSLRYDDAGVLGDIVGSVPSPQDLGAVSGPSLPMANLQMLLMLSARDPAIAQALGVDTQMLNREVAKMQEAQRLQKMAPEEKAHQDTELWTNWLNRYGGRLLQERQAGADPTQRVQVMNTTNPKYILRQWIAEYAIQQAEKGNYSVVQQVLHVLQHPYDDTAPSLELDGSEGGASCAVLPALDGPVPDWGKKLCVSCSS